MTAVNSRRKVGVGLLGSGVVGEAIQDILFQQVKGQNVKDVDLEIRKIYTRSPKGKKWFAKRKSLFAARAEEVIDDPGVDIVIEALGFQSASQLPRFRDYILRAFRGLLPWIVALLVRCFRPCLAFVLPTVHVSTSQKWTTSCRIAQRHLQTPQCSVF